MIHLELEVTAKQLLDVANALNGVVAYEVTEIAGSPDDSPVLPTELNITRRKIFDEHQAKKVSVGAADAIGGIEYEREFKEWLADGCPELSVVPANVTTTDTPPPPAIKPGDKVTVTGTTTGNDGEGVVTSVTTDDMPPATVELDSNGLPWDARIHGKAKNKNKGDGSWKYIKGIDRETLVPQVEVELRAALDAAPPAESVFASPTPGANGDTPPPPPEGGPTTFPEMLLLVTAAKASKKISDADIDAALAAVGLAKFGDLAVRSDLVAQFALVVGV